MVWLHQRCLQPVCWVFSHLPPCGECLCVKSQRVNATPFKEQLLENQNPAPFRYKLCHSNQSLPCTEWKCLAHMQQPHRSGLHVNCSGPAVLFSMTAREGWDSQRAKKLLFLENSSPLPSSFPSKKKKIKFLSLFYFFWWGLSSSERTLTFLHFGVLLCS